MTTSVSSRFSPHTLPSSYPLRLLSSPLPFPFPPLTSSTGAQGAELLQCEGGILASEAVDLFRRFYEQGNPNGLTKAPSPRQARDAWGQDHNLMSQTWFGCRPAFSRSIQTLAHFASHAFAVSSFLRSAGCFHAAQCSRSKPVASNHPVCQARPMAVSPNLAKHSSADSMAATDTAADELDDDDNRGGKSGKGWEGWDGWEGWGGRGWSGGGGTMGERGRDGQVGWEDVEGWDGCDGMRPYHLPFFGSFSVPTPFLTACFFPSSPPHFPPSPPPHLPLYPPSPSPPLPHFPPPIPPFPSSPLRPQVSPVCSTAVPTTASAAADPCSQYTPKDAAPARPCMLCCNLCLLSPFRNPLPPPLYVFLSRTNSCKELTACGLPFPPASPLIPSPPPTLRAYSPPLFPSPSPRSPAVQERMEQSYCSARGAYWPARL
ncbi:unnamed protein product [Closterium sp. NIES-65]|nr:unnamed protein product [Closterium sp. NIES-65]